MLRPYQKECSDNVIADLEEHDKLGVVAPTGSGKTVCIIDIVKRFLEANPGSGVLILSHLSLLTTQTAERFKQHANATVGILQAQQMPGTMDRIVISTMQSSRVFKKIAKFIDKSFYKIGLVVVDECHYILTESYKKVLSYFPHAKVIGFTATPFKSARLMTSYFDKLSFSISLQELIDQGYLVPPVLHGVSYKTGELEERMAMVRGIYEEKHKGEKAIVFMKTIEEAKLMRMAFVDAGINARAITSEITNTATRDDLLASFQDGDIDVLTTVNVLTAGVDLPAARILFLPYQTKSPTMYLQRVGRALRLHPGKTHADIYMFGDAPSISRESYRELHEQVLTKGAKDKERETMHDELEYLDFIGETSSDQYHWTKEVCEIINQLSKQGMTHFSRMLDRKEFPKRFLGNIKDLHERLPDHKPPAHLVGSVTPKQRELLTAQGFAGEKLDGLSKAEAANMLTVFLSKEPGYAKWVLQSGQHAGKHVSMVPPSYIKLVLNDRNMRHSGVGQLLTRYRRASKK